MVLRLKLILNQKENEPLISCGSSSFDKQAQSYLMLSQSYSKTLNANKTSTRTHECFRN